MARLYVLMGLPGSGKSTYASTKGLKVLSSDAIRKELFGSEENQTNPKKVFDILYKRVHKSLKNNEDCIYDATNIRKYHRQKITREFSEAEKKILIYIKKDIETCIYQDTIRQRTVGKEVIEKMQKNLEEPCYDEGWDEIIII